MRRLGRVLVAVFALVGLLTLSGVGIAAWLTFHLGGSSSQMPDRAVLTLDLDAPFHAVRSEDPMAVLAGETSYVLRDVVAAVDAAAGDPKVVGLFATLGHSGLGLADIQDLRDAVTRFRASGKPAVLFAETIGEGEGGTADYYLASAFGPVWVQPSGELGLTGMMAESPFFKGTLDLLGIKPQFFARHEYKSAIETFTQSSFSPAHREILGRLLDSWSGQMVAGIAAARQLPPERVQGLVGKGPYLPAEALDAGLIDHVGYRDEAWSAVAGKGAAAAEGIDVNDYAGHRGVQDGVKVALITGVGTIHRGESRPGLDDDGGFGSETIAQAFRDAVEDDAVKAILFRVDSPGGSYTASDTIWHEVKLARAAGKPVVVSMGNVAASGGYFVAMGADRVLAQPATLTGSIGVFTGKVVLNEFWTRLGISWDELHRGDNAGMWSMNSPFSPEAKVRVEALLDHIYDDFTAKAVEGRAIPADRIDQLARGRVWTGADAQANGLIDGLGGWSEAITAVRAVAALAPGAAVRLVPFPEPRRPWEVVAQALAGGSIADRAAMARLAAVAEPVLPLLSTLGRAGSDGHASLRLAPDLERAAR